MMKTIIVSVLALFFLTACASNTAGMRVDGMSQRVLFADNVLAGRVQIEEIKTVQAHGHTRGVVQVLSRYRGDQHLQYRFYWYDDNGLEVNPQPGTWQALILRGGEQRTMSEVSVNPQGTQFRLQIRELNN